MSVSKEMEDITSTFDISITKNDIKKKFVGEIKNKLVHFFIKKGIIKQEALYIYSTCREYSYNKQNNIKNYIICCDYSKIKFINEDTSDEIINVYKHINIYKYFQAKDNNLESILNRKLNFSDDNNRRYKLISNIIKDKFYIDFACGYGGMLFKCNDICKKCIGIEVMKTAIDILTDKGFIVKNNIELIENNTVDIISIFQSLELLDNHRKYLELFYKKLKKGGKLVIETSNAKKALYEIYNNKGYKQFITSYRRLIYTEDAIKCLLKDIGYTNIDITYHQRYKLSNHLGWITNNYPGNDITLFDDNQLNKEYSKILIKNKLADTLFIVCQK